MIPAMTPRQSERAKSTPASTPLRIPFLGDWFVRLVLPSSLSEVWVSLATIRSKKSKNKAAKSQNDLLKNYISPWRLLDQEQLKKLAPILRDYTADYCDPRSKIPLIKQVSTAGFVRLAAQLATDHYENCARDPEFLEYDFEYNEEIGEYPKALEIINRLIEWDPASAQYRFKRGKLYEDTTRFEKALMDYISTNRSSRETATSCCVAILHYVARTQNSGPTTMLSVCFRGSSFLSRF